MPLKRWTARRGENVTDAGSAALRNEPGAPTGLRRLLAPGTQACDAEIAEYGDGIATRWSIRAARVRWLSGPRPGRWHSERALARIRTAVDPLRHRRDAEEQARSRGAGDANRAARSFADRNCTKRGQVYAGLGKRLLQHQAQAGYTYLQGTCRGDRECSSRNPRRGISTRCSVVDARLGLRANSKGMKMPAAMRIMRTAHSNTPRRAGRRFFHFAENASSLVGAARSSSSVARRRLREASRALEEMTGADLTRAAFVARRNAQHHLEGPRLSLCRACAAIKSTPRRASWCNTPDHGRPGSANGEKPGAGKPSAKAACASPRPCGARA